MAQLVKCLTLDFGSGHDLIVHEFEPHIGLCTDSMETPWDSLSPSFSAPPLLTNACALSLKNKEINLKRNKLETYFSSNILSKIKEL